MVACQGADAGRASRRQAPLRRRCSSPRPVHVRLERGTFRVFSSVAPYRVILSHRAAPCARCRPTSDVRDEGGRSRLLCEPSKRKFPRIDRTALPLLDAGDNLYSFFLSLTSLA